MRGLNLGLISLGQDKTFARTRPTAYIARQDDILKKKGNEANKNPP